VAATDTVRPRFAEASQALLHDVILDAGEELLTERGWGGVSMAAVAERAGVSRQTLYNEFGDRAGFALAYVLRETDRFLGGVEEAILANTNQPSEALAAGIEVFLTEAAENPMVRAIVVGEGGSGLLELVTTDGGPVLATGTERVASIIAQKWPGMASTDVHILAETIVRLAISHAALPTAPPRETAEALSRVLGPLADRLLGGAR
jgi:AcrR family transcriptional regulator